ncbi:MAG: O-antigen ligase family protein [Gemmatimonadota bacterium]|nr:O-antigen ligase family protein [Gemmatimonadota bacterium]
MPGSLMALLLMILISLGVGGAMAMYGPVVLLGAAGAVGAVLMIRRPYWGVLLLAATLPVENATVFSGFTAARLVGLGVATGWLVGKILRNESFSRVFGAALTWLSIAFLTLVISSTFWADNTDAVRSGFIRLVQLVALGVIVLDVIDSWEDVQKLFRVLIASGIVAAGLTMFDAVAGDAVRAGENIAGINGTAELLVTLMPCAFFLIVSERNLLWRLMGVLYIGLASGAVLGTLSRASIMLLPVVIVVMSLQVLRAGRGRGWLLVGFAVVTVAVFSQEDSFARLERRIQSIVPYLTTTVQADAGGLSVRGYHLAVGVAMFRDHPVLGVGYENFGDQFLYRYQFIVPGGTELWLSRRSPHSSHVGIMADLGLVGIILWLSILTVVLGSVWRAYRHPAVRQDQALTTLTFGLLISLLLQAGPYAFYGPNQKSKLLWVLLGLGVAVWRLARTHEETEFESDMDDEAGVWIEESPVYPQIRQGPLVPIGSGGSR